MLKRYVLKISKNPFGIYLLWILLLLFFCVVGIPFLSMGHSGGEQVPLTLIGHTANIAVIGFVLISIISPILYWRWYMKYMFIPLIIPILLICLLVYWLIEIYVSNGYYFPL